MLTVLVIARDEASVIGRCLDSLYYTPVYDDWPSARRPIWDELIVVVDSRTTDDTAAIAIKHGARVEVFEWQNDDYSITRNYAERLASNEYVFWIDADEVLVEGHDTIRTIVETGKEIGVRPVIIMERDPLTGTPMGTFPRQVMLHKKGEYKWEEAIHEWSKGPEAEVNDGILMEQIARPEGDHPQNMDNLRAAAELNDRGLFYLAGAYAEQQHFMEALALYDLMLKIPGPPTSLRMRAACMRGHIYWSLLGKETDPAIQAELLKESMAAYLDAIKIVPNTAEPYFYLGEMHLAMGQYAVAEGWFMLSIPWEPNPYTFDIDIYTTHRHQRLEECRRVTKGVPVAAV